MAAAVLLFGIYLYTLPQPGPRPEAPVRQAADDVASETASERRAEAPEPDDAPPLRSEPAGASLPELAVPRQEIELRNDALRVSLSNHSPGIDLVELPGFADRKGDDAGPVQLVTSHRGGMLQLSLGEEGLGGGVWKVERKSGRSVELRAERAGVEIRRELELDERGFGGRLTVEVRNRSSRPLRPRIELGFFAQERPSRAPDHFLNYSLVALQDGSVKRRAVRGIGSAGFLGGLFGGSKEGVLAEPVELVGVDSQYFLLAALSPNPMETQAYYGPLGSDEGQTSLQYHRLEVPPGTSVERSFRLYFGPKTREATRSVDARFAPVVDMGWSWVRPLVDLFGGALHWIYENVVSNYGVAIIILTVLLRAVTYPLTQRSMKSMKRLGEITPLMKEIQEKHRDQPEKLQQEMMALYRERGINPLSAMGGGCVPMLIQMPFMIALYFALQASIDLRHAPFALWIDDLSAPEDLFSIGPIPVRLLPLAMGASMVLQQRLSPSPGGDAQQRQMMTMMSLMFVVLFYQFPSGLVLYWFVSNLLGIAQQFWVNRTPAQAAS
jgi:YidC/Oxa1 family membrane protein insertase